MSLAVEPARVVSPRAATALGVALAGAVVIASCTVWDGGAPAIGDPDDPHAALLVHDRFPSAETCGTCHPRHYREWSASPHAYAQLSPVFNAMHGTLLVKTKGTIGDFCLRCHTPVGTALGEPLFAANVDRHPVSREGVTCIVCHRVDQGLGKINGRRPLAQGSLLAPVFGPTGGDEVRRVLGDPQFGVNADPEGQGRKIHGEARQLPQLTQPGFCGTCHDVTAPNGFRFEEAFSEYKLSPAAARGETCQDCHMGVEPGVAAGYRRGPAAVVGGQPTRERKITDHSFVGPDYSIVHPGLFPHNPDAQQLATVEEWLQFDHEAGWGTDAFEDQVTDDVEFPPRWGTLDDRIDAREILDQQRALLDEVAAKRLALLQRGYRLGDLEVARAGRDGLAFRVPVHNGTDGHNVPTGFIAERLVYLAVTVTDADGAVVFRSGDLDPNGDLRDAHSRYVHNGELPVDPFLFSLQSKFMIRTLRGGEREQVLAVNDSVDVLPFVRPETFPSVLTGQPAGGRIHRAGIPPGGTRHGDYQVAADALRGRPGPLRVEVVLRAGMVPANLVHAIQDVGFDFGLSPREVARRVVAGHQDLARRAITVAIDR